MIFVLLAGLPFLLNEKHLTFFSLDEFKFFNVEFETEIWQLIVVLLENRATNFITDGDFFKVEVNVVCEFTGDEGMTRIIPAFFKFQGPCQFSPSENLLDMLLL